MSAGTLPINEVPINEVAETALPAELRRRSGTGLCLSGGGYRAALFHLGAARRLNERGLLGELRTVSSVSGGSILAAFLARRLPWPITAPLSGEVWEQEVAQPFRRFCAQDLRTGPLLSRLLPWNWWGPPAIERVAALLERRLGLGRLVELPLEPNFVVCATDLTFGVNWIFERGRMGDYLAGYARHGGDYPLAHAVAASACFPPLFGPLPVRLEVGALRGGKARTRGDFARLVAGLRLTDGGNYDNLGLEPVWKSHQIVLVSDGGSSFNFAEDRGWLWRLLRYPAILDAQSRALRKRWLLADAGAHRQTAVYWSVGQHVRAYAARLPSDAACLREGYAPDTARLLGRIRTDFDSFSDAEMSALENHGYTLAEAALQAYLPATPESPFHLPRPLWRDDERVIAALAGSHATKLLGRRSAQQTQAKD